MGYLRVDLGRRDVLMSQHFGKRFQRYAVRQADRSRIGMARKVERELFVDAARAGDMLQAVVNGIQRRHPEEIAAAGKAPIFIQQEQRIR